MSRVAQRITLGLVVLLLSGLTCFRAVGQTVQPQAVRVQSARTVQKWTPASAMQSARSGSCSAVLADGRILITGGADANGPLATVEVFGLNRTFSGVSSMQNARQDHVCATLPDGTVLVAGGTAPGGGATNAAEIYSPDKDTWTAAAAMTVARTGAAAVTLQDGRVLIAGGTASGVPTNTLEIYDPATGAFSRVAGLMSSPRMGHAAALLHDGRVLIAGGSDGNAVLDTVDVFDASAGTITAGARLSGPRVGLSATTLLDGNVLFAGGNDGEKDLATAEVFNLKTGLPGKPVAMAAARRDHIAISLPKNNTVLLVGGTAAGAAVDAAELYIPWRGQFQSAGTLQVGRAAASAAPEGVRGRLLVIRRAEERGGRHGLERDVFLCDADQRQGGLPAGRHGGADGRGVGSERTGDDRDDGRSSNP